MISAFSSSSHFFTSPSNSKSSPSIHEVHHHTHHLTTPHSTSSTSLTPCPPHSHSLSSACSSRCSGGFIRRSFWNTRCSCIFSALPDELLILDVFPFLDCSALSVLQSVCTRWRWLSGDKSLWSRVDLSKAAQKIDDKAFHSIMERVGQNLQSLHLCNCSRLTQTSIGVFQTIHKQLKSLHLCNLRLLKDSNISLLAQACPRLEEVSLFGCISITDSGIQALTTHCKSIKSLNLRGCTKLTSSSLLLLGSEVQTLNISGCRNMKEQSLINIANRCPNIEMLNAHAVEISDHGIEALSTNCSHLKTLQISSANPFGGSPLFTDEGISYITRLKQLESLNIQGSGNITDAELGILTRHCSKLQRLNLGGCFKVTDSGLKAIAHSALLLTHLSVFQCYLLTDQSLIEVAHKLTLLKELDCHSLVHLSPAFVRELYTPQVTQQSGIEQDENSPVYFLPNLESLDIGSCKSIRAEAVQPFLAVRPNVKVNQY
jgi:hypothetical protein